MKKAISIFLIVIAALELTGCEAMQRKFTRKKKRTPIRPRFYQEGAAETRPHLELYMMHYTYWKTWAEELVAKAGTNNKRDLLASREALGHLRDMRKYLSEEKAKELDIYIENTRNITDQITEGGGAPEMRIGYLKQKLDNIRARVVRNFYYKKVRDDILPNE